MPSSPFKPGSCAMRLQNIQFLSSPSKITLLKSIANDISAVFIYIAKQAEAGNLSVRHTAPINDVIRIIKDTEVSQRRMLEKRVGRYERQIKRVRAERRWIQREFKRVVKRAEAVSGKWRERVKGLKGELKEVREDLEMLRREREMLKLKGRAEEPELDEGRENSPSHMQTAEGGNEDKPILCD